MKTEVQYFITSRAYMILVYIFDVHYYLQGVHEVADGGSRYAVHTVTAVHLEKGYLH